MPRRDREHKGRRLGRRKDRYNALYAYIRCTDCPERLLIPRRKDVRWISVCDACRAERQKREFLKQYTPEFLKDLLRRYRADKVIERNREERTEREYLRGCDCGCGQEYNVRSGYGCFMNEEHALVYQEAHWNEEPWPCRFGKGGVG